MKRVSLSALAFSVTLLMPAITAAEYPDKPVRVVVPDLVGSTLDLVTRLVAPELGARVGNQFIVDNRGGADGLIGTELAAKATPDGHTLLVGTTRTLAVMRHLQKEVPFDALKDFVPIGLLAVRPYLLVAHPSLPAKTVSELIVLAKAQPGKLVYGSAGKGSSTHLAMVAFDDVAGIDLRHIPYKSGPQAAMALVGARVNVSMISIRNALAHVRAERLRALAITSGRRSAQLPQVPTVDESGLTGFKAASWFALLAPARTPRDILVRLDSALQQVIGSPEARKRLAEIGVEPGDADAAVLPDLIRRDIELYSKLTKISGIQVN